jgi:hypothetical protein
VPPRAVDRARSTDRGRTSGAATRCRDSCRGVAVRACSADRCRRSATSSARVRRFDRLATLDLCTAQATTTSSSRVVISNP